MDSVYTPTHRDLVIAKAVSLQVRLFGQRQLADILWSGDIANARRRLKRLVAAGLLLRTVTLAQPLPELLRPICNWTPGESEPDMSSVAFRLQARWRYRTLRSTVVYWATASTKAHFGGVSATQLAPQVTHDLGVAAVWLWYYQHHTLLAQQYWLGEDQIDWNEPGQSLPDAVLTNDEGEPQMLVEFGGTYSKHRLIAFHDTAVSQGLPYQVW